MRHPPPAVVEPAPMEGAGAYNRNSRVQAGGLRPAIPLLEEAARTVSLAAGNEPVVIADYGVASGHNSMAPMSAAIAVLRRRIAGERAISVIHTDVPDNDFAVLFRAIENDPDSYRRGTEAVFSAAVGRS
ncbi:MAG TPA: SAM-dependent methyltransferase, partial [Candidatus Polarisedimenticolia bacterium]|nr:SAM-dependent methyltransferase [Candidatus Polarisedimenticolia bacterium]